MPHSVISTEKGRFMVFNILYAIQAMRSPVLDQIMLAITGIMGFSRMYLFVYFPTDVVLGVVLALVAKALLDRIDKVKKSRTAA